MKRIFIAMIFLASATSAVQACDSIKRCFCCCSTKSNKVQPAPQAAAQVQAPAQQTREVFRTGSPEYQRSLEQAVLRMEAQRLQRPVGAGVQQFGVINMSSSHTVYNYQPPQDQHMPQEPRVPVTGLVAARVPAVRLVVPAGLNDQPDAAPLPAHSRTVSSSQNGAGTRPATPGAIELLDEKAAHVVTALDLLREHNRVMGVSNITVD